MTVHKDMVDTVFFDMIGVDITAIEYSDVATVGHAVTAVNYTITTPNTKLG